MEKEFSKNKNYIKIKINTGNIKIYKENILLPKIIYSESFDVEEYDYKMKVTQKQNVGTRLGGITFNSFGNSTIISGNNMVIVNGKVLSGNNVSIVTTGSSEEQEVRIVIPGDCNNFDMDVSLSAGNLEAYNVNLNNFNARIDAGEISMMDVDIMNSDMKVSSGSISLFIKESSQNYETKLKASCGSTNQKNVEDCYDDYTNNQVIKRLLKARIDVGSIDVVFKGRK